MNAETFLANFSHVVNASDGVQSLRQLIMASALAGDFSSPNESLPDDIFEQIERARSSYFSKQRRREKPLAFGPSLINEFRIPSGWEWVRVGQICDLQTGATPSRQRSDYFGGKIRWLVSGDINQREIFDCRGRITDVGLENSNCKVLPVNSVLIALNGQGKTRATVALLRVLAACNQSLVAMIPFNEKIVSPEFIFLALRYRYFEIRDITGQDQRRGLNMGLVSELSVPLAPIAEQKRIVAKVDELMALCDRVERQQQERQKLFSILSQACHDRFTQTPDTQNLNRLFDELGHVSPEDLRKTILNLAVKGGLVPQLPREESAFVLLKQIKNEREQLISDRKMRRDKPLAPPDQELVPHRIPDSWKWVKVGEASLFLDYGTSVRSHVSSVGIPVISMGDIQGGKILLGTQKRVPKEIEDLPDLYLNKFDLLYNRTNSAELVGKTGIYLGEDHEYTFASYLIRIHCSRKWTDPLYFNMAMNSPFFRETQIVPHLKQQCGQANVNGTVLRNMVIPLPPLAEQRRIVAKVDQLMALVETLKKQQQERDRLAESFAQAIVASLTGTKIDNGEKPKMKVPKTELISNLKLGTDPKAKEDAPLAALLIKAKGELSAKSLWQQSGLTIDCFYQQLKTELAAGSIEKPDPKEAVVKLLKEDSETR
jgi:type I restriction enzyme S subunit